MSTKIQINSLQALVHLLEGEGDVSVEIRRSVLKEYETKHILPSIVARIDEIVTKRVHDLLFSGSKWGNIGSSLSAEYVDVVKSVVEREARSLVSSLVKEAVAEAATPEELEQRVSALVQDVSFSEVQKQIKAKIAEVL